METLATLKAFYSLITVMLIPLLFLAVFAFRDIIKTISEWYVDRLLVSQILILRLFTKTLG